MIDHTKTTPEKLAEMNDSLIVDNNYLRGQLMEIRSENKSRLQAENAALKAELKAINAALDDPRTDLTMTACEVIVALKEQIVQAHLKR